ncbi:MAG: hypothetical protein AAF809_08860 [Bacteroidota bacterium]
MPQFEFDPAETNAPVQLIRGRDAADAARRVLAVPVDTIAITAPDEEGWQTVTEDEAVAGRLRLHQRMRFRRD